MKLNSFRIFAADFTLSLSPPASASTTVEYPAACPYVNAAKVMRAGRGRLRVLTAEDEEFEFSGPPKDSR